MSVGEVRWILKKSNATSEGKDSSVFKSPTQGASATIASANDISRRSTDMDSMEMSMLLDTTQQPSVASPSVVFQQ